MTCIAGVVHKGKVFIGGDSAASLNGSVVLHANGKVFLNEGFLIGTCGTARLSNLARYKFKPPELIKGEDLDAYIATRFVDELRNCLKEAGNLTISDNYESGDGMLLVGFRSRIYRIDESFAAIRSLDDYAAIGSGMDIALGALFATKSRAPNDRLKIALEAAAYLDDGVRGPFHIEVV